MVGQFVNVLEDACTLTFHACRCDPPVICHMRNAGADPVTGPPSGLDAVKLIVEGETDSIPTVAHTAPNRVVGRPKRVPRAWAPAARHVKSEMIVQTALNMVSWR